MQSQLSGRDPQGPLLGDAKPLVYSDGGDRAVAAAYGSLRAPVMGYAHAGSRLEEADGGRHAESGQPVSRTAATVVTPMHDVKMAGKPTDTRVVADQVYRLILDRIKTELRMRGR